MSGYVNGMIDTVTASVDVDSVESIFRDELANSDSAAGTVVPILRHVLSSEDNSLFSDDIIARVRGMLQNITVQLLDRLESAGDEPFTAEHDSERISALRDMLIANAVFVGHLHALALEWQLTERLQARLGTDPVLTPLLQELIASKDAETAALAMRFLAAQARHCQSQRRMRLPLLELPGDLLHAAVLVMRTFGDEDRGEDSRAAAAEASIRAEYDEALTRLGMMTRLVMAMGSRAISALSITHAGAAIFLSALSIGSGFDRDMAVLSTNEAQAARLAL
ncbi:MAG: hypothetical protein KUG65_12865, partial [Sphingomonadaceae bacterium]|nr:hypothetical protein [Sphingomonadaceae bacterium]